MCEKKRIPYISNGDSYLLFERLRPNSFGTFNVTTKFTLNNEVKVQYELYQRLYNSNLSKNDPPVPAIVFSRFDISPSFKKDLLGILLQNLEYDTPKNSDLHTLKDLKEAKNMLTFYFNEKISIIGMEFLDGYMQLSDVLTTITDEFKRKCYIVFTIYELMNLYVVGEIGHGDFHSNNIMIHTDIFYYGTYDTDNNPIGGRVMVIDFEKAQSVNLGIEKFTMLDNTVIDIIKYLLDYNNKDPNKIKEVIKEVFKRIINYGYDNRHIEYYLNILDIPINDIFLDKHDWFFEELTKILILSKSNSQQYEKTQITLETDPRNHTIGRYTYNNPANIMMTGGNKNRKKHKNTSIFIPLTPSQYRLKNTILLSSVKIKAKTTKEKKTTTKKKK